MNSLKRPSAHRGATQVRALAATCGAGMLWGSGALVVNVLVAEHGFTPENISFWRFFIGALVLLVVFGKGISWSRLQPLLTTVVIAGSAMSGYVLFWFLGIELMGAAVPTLIALCLPPVIVTIVAVIRGHETADLQLVLVLVGALSGTVLIIAEHGGITTTTDSYSLLLGVSYSIASALLYAYFSMISGRISLALGAGAATACLTVVAALVMSLFALFKPFTWPTQLPPQAWFLYLGVVTAALALLAFSWGAARLKATVLTVATLLEPLTAVLLAALLLDQHLAWLQWLGAVLLLLSIWVLGNRAAAKSIN